MTWPRTLARAALLGLLLVRPAAPQSEAGTRLGWDGPELGAYVGLGLGQGPFRQFVKVAGGFGFYGTLPVALNGGLALRADFSSLFHEFDSWSGIPSFDTESYITSLRAGPQVALTLGHVRLYGFWAGGFSYFATDANPDDACGCQFTQTLHDDLTWTTELGGGVRIALLRPSPGGELDFGVRTQRNGEASYVTAGGVTRNGDGSFTVSPIRSEARLLVIHLGVSVWLR